jgi:cysteine-rich repeat protein
MYGTWEECDDGNDSSADGCDSACQYESGYTCPEPGSPCVLAECGNGYTEYPAEDCDDGNDVASDGCTDCRYDGGGYGGMGAGGTGMGGAGTAGAGGSFVGGAGSGMGG